MDEMKLNELAECAGVPARTVRLYISRGLVPGPLRRGREAAYGAAHVEALATVQRLQAEGLTLSEIGRRMAGPPDRGRGIVVEETLCFRVAEDVTVYVQGGTGGWRMHRIRAAVSEMARMLDEQQDGNEEDRSR